MRLHFKYIVQCLPDSSNEDMQSKHIYYFAVFFFKFSFCDLYLFTHT